MALRLRRRAGRVRRILALCRCRTLAKNSNIVMINTTGKMPVY
ncbi:MAG: hypothetical protein ACLQBD_14245 [Syntrophobacteraceae bacterium]